MKKITFLFCMAVFCMTSMALHAQTASDNRFIRTGVHSIGLNLYPFIAHLIEKTDLIVPFEISYKYQLKGKDRAWRFGLLGQYYYFNQEFNMQPQDDEIRPQDAESIATLFKGGAYAGHEWQKGLGKQWLLAIGADVRYVYQQQNNWQNYISSGTEDDGHYYSNGVSLQPFAGLAFAITSHWLLYIDFRVDLTYNHITTDHKNANQALPSKSSSNTTEYHFNLLPFQQINIIYSF